MYVVLKTQPKLVGLTRSDRVDGDGQGQGEQGDQEGHPERQQGPRAHPCAAAADICDCTRPGVPQVKDVGTAGVCRREGGHVPSVHALLQARVEREQAQAVFRGAR